jgi:RNA polymerase subunit RPABC4/transcription elongation factor Spt4
MGLPHEISERLSQPNCVLCGKEKENKTNALCNNCSPYIYDENKKPHQQIRLSKEWRINRERRLKKANNTCEWCESKPESGLTVHHENHINYYKIWYDLVNKFIEEMNKKNEAWKGEWDKAWNDDSINEMVEKVKQEIDKEAKATGVEACPYCDSSSLSKRKYKKSNFFCSNCRKEFNTAKVRADKKYIFHPRKIKLIAQKLISLKFVEKAIEVSFTKLKEGYEKEVKNQVDKYLNMIDTEVLCKRCHWATENDKMLCPICKKKYYRIPSTSCSECYKKRKVLSIISKKEIFEKLMNHLKVNSHDYGFEELRPIFEKYRLGKISDIEFLNQGIKVSEFFLDMIIWIFKEI